MLNGNLEVTGWPVLVVEGGFAFLISRIVDGTSQTVDPVGVDVRYLTDLVLRKSRLLSKDNPSPFL